MWKFAGGLVSGVWLAQTYKLPNLYEEFKRFEKLYLKKK